MSIDWKIEIEKAESWSDKKECCSKYIDLGKQISDEAKAYRSMWEAEFDLRKKAQKELEEWKSCANELKEWNHKNGHKIRELEKENELLKLARHKDLLENGNLRRQNEIMEKGLDKISKSECSHCLNRQRAKETLYEAGKK